MIDRPQNPNNWIAPVAYTIPSPVGVDTVITSLQTAGLDLLWLEKSYGRAMLRSRRRQEGEEESNRNFVDVFFPSVWQGVGTNGQIIDMVNVVDNDNLNAYSFFKADNERTPVDYTEDRNTWQTEIDWIFWMNLARVDDTKLYPYMSEIEKEIIEVIQGAQLTGANSVEILSVTDNPEEIFDGYSIDIVSKQNLTYPYYGLRFRLNAVYFQEC